MMLSFSEFIKESVTDYLHMAQFDEKHLNDFIHLIEPYEKEYELTGRKILKLRGVGNTSKYFFSYDKGGKQKSFKKFLHSNLWPIFNKKYPKTKWIGK